MKSMITKIIILILTFTAGAVCTYVYPHNTKMVQLEETRSGMFIIRDRKIYEVLELPTNNPNFQK